MNVYVNAWKEAGHYEHQHGSNSYIWGRLGKRWDSPWHCPNILHICLHVGCIIKTTKQTKNQSPKQKSWYKMKWTFGTEDLYTNRQASRILSLGLSMTSYKVTFWWFCCPWGVRRPAGRFLILSPATDKPRLESSWSCWPENLVIDLFLSAK